MTPIAHPGRLLRRELAARGLSANRLALDLGVPSGRITDILNGRRAISADTAVRLGLGYPRGPLEWGDHVGAERVLDVLREMHDRTGDPRYRPSRWLVERAALGLPLTESGTGPSDLLG